MKPAIRKKLAIALGVVALSVLIAGFLIPKLLDPDRWHNRIVSELEKALGGKVRIDDISWGFLKGLWLEVDGVEITGASAFPLDIKLSRLYADVSVLPLLKRKIVLNRLVLESPEVQLRLQPGPQEAIREAKTPFPGAKPAGIPLPIEIEELLVANGRVRMEDSLPLPGKPVARDFDDIVVKASNLAPGREMSFDISMKDRDVQGLGSFKAQGSFAGLTDSLTLQNPKLTVHATFSAVQTDALKPFLGKAPWVQQLSGTLSMTVNYEGDLGSRHRAEGSMDLSRIAFSYPSLWEAALPGAETKITYRADLQSDDLTVENLEVRVGKFSLRAQGDVTGLKKRPLIKNASFSAAVPLQDSVPLFPWKVLGDSAPFVRSIFEGGGRVDIDQAVLPPIDLAEPPANAVALLNAIESTSRISGVSVELSPGIPRIKNIDIHVRLAQGTAQVQVLRDQFTTVDLPGISGKVAKLFEAPLIEVTVKGPVQVSNQPPEDLAAFFRRCGLEEVNGSVDLDAAVVVDTSQPANVQIRGNIGIQGVQAKTTLSPVRLEGLRADLAIAPDAANITHLSTTVSVPAGPSAPGGRFDLKLEARVDEWSRRPAVTLQRMKTSAVALPVVASLIPWEKLGKSAEPVKQTLLNGGTVEIEEAALPRVELFNLPKSPAELLPKAKVAAGFAGLAIEPDPSLPGLEDIRGRITLENGVLTAAGVQGRMGPLSLPDLNIRVSRLESRPKVTVAAKGPVKLAATSDERIEDLLKRYALKSLVVSANMDMRGDFDENLHGGWVVDGSLALKGVRAETFPEGVVMDNLQGRVSVNHKKATNITAENVKGRINQAPFQLSGKITGVGTPNLVIDATANAKHLNLAHLRELSPGLKKLNLAGTVDMDLDIYLPYAAPKKSRLNGMLATRNLGFQLAQMTVERGDSQFNLAANTAVIKKAQAQVNGTSLAVTGQIANPLEPDIRLLVASPDLDLDRLLAPANEAKSGVKPSQEKDAHAPEKHAKTEWPPVVLKTAAQVQVGADAGRYKGTEFQNLKLDATYDRGVIKKGDLSFGMEGGQVSMTGSGDLRDPEHVTFNVSPNITSMRLETLAALLGVPEVSVSGPISLTGRLQGRTGSSEDLLAGLSGDMQAQIGPGRVARIG
ncbi:MAG: AsmA family protein, partial [Desulfobacterota bacterium]|nr:AsmA family protein [Thermodesulfobacteriota bacterium]